MKFRIYLLYQMMSKEEKEGVGEILQISDSPTDLSSVPTSSAADLDSSSSRADMESELDSAESSMVSLTDVAEDSPKLRREFAIPVSPLVQEMQSRGTWSGSCKGSPALSHVSRQSGEGPLFSPKDPFLDLEGKIDKFKWTVSHIGLLEELLASIIEILDKWTKR